MSAALHTPLRIAVVGHIRFPVAQPFMGGMEAHCDLLVRALAAAGHDPVLFASGDSAADLPLHPIAPRAYEAQLPWHLWRGTPELNDWLRAAYARGWAAIRAGGFDVVHNNSLFPDIAEWAARDGVPMVTSLHVPPFATLADALRASAVPWHALTATSRDQQRLWAAATGLTPAVAYNGIDLARWRYAPAVGAGARAIWCGRITPTKGTVEALVAATAAGVALDVAGPVDCLDYWRLVEPLLVGGHRYLRHLSGDALTAVLASASVALCTPMWDEPFGLVAAEALACGTPVAALARGALAEVVGDCGALAATPAELPAAIHAAMRVDRAACRARAEATFGVPAMLARYAEAYAAARSAAAASSRSRTRAELA